MQVVPVHNRHDPPMVHVIMVYRSAHRLRALEFNHGSVYDAKRVHFVRRNVVFLLRGRAAKSSWRGRTRNDMRKKKNK